ncbi:MAG: hypothetical protein HRT35_25100, partial [Algicola sp.]|nr:hypothetical protein [Algicola sp.]
TTPAPTSACGEMDTGDTCIGIQAGGGQHHFVYHEPQNRMAYAPIVIFMHGGGDSPITIAVRFKRVSLLTIWAFWR